MVVFTVELIGCGSLGFSVGYALGLRETKRRLKAHKEVTDRLMNAGLSPPTAHGLTGHDDMIDAASLSGTVYPTYGGISRSASPSAVATQQGQANQLFGGSQMQNPITYSTTPSKFASIAAMSKRPATTAEQRSEFRKRIYEELKKAM